MYETGARNPDCEVCSAADVAGMDCSQYMEISPQKPETGSEEENQLNIPEVHVQMLQVQAEMEIMPAVQDVQEMLDRLPSAAEVTDLNAAEQDTVFAEVQNAYATLEQLDENALAKRIALSALLVDVAAVYGVGNTNQCAWGYPPWRREYQ